MSVKVHCCIYYSMDEFKCGSLFSSRASFEGLKINNSLYFPPSFILHPSIVITLQLLLLNYFYNLICILLWPQKINNFSFYEQTIGATFAVKDRGTLCDYMKWSLSLKFQSGPYYFHNTDLKNCFAWDSGNTAADDTEKK